MYMYELQSQYVAAALDFERCSISGSTRVHLTRRGGGLEGGAEAGELKYLLPLSVPQVTHASYGSVTVNGTEAPFHVAKTPEPEGYATLVNGSCNNVDLISMDGIHVASEQVSNGLLYVELREYPRELVLELEFEYLQLKSCSDAVYYRRYWMLPRCSTSFREYVVLMSGSSTEQWFPMILVSDRVSISGSCVYELEVQAPVDHVVISGLQVNEDAAVNNSGNQTEGTEVFRFRLATEAGGMGPMSRHCFGIFAGEFDLLEEAAVQRKRKVLAEAGEHRFVEDEDSLESFSAASKCKLSNSSALTYVTLKGFGFLLEATNIATAECIETYKHVMDLEMPSSLYLLFLPLQPFQQAANVATHIRTQNVVDITRCTAFTGSENVLYSGFLQSLCTNYEGMYYQSGNNLIVYSIDALHSYSDIDHDPRSIDCRILIAHGLALPFMLKSWVNPSRDMHVDLMLRSYLVGQFVKRNMGLNEYKARQWALRELFATEVETHGDDYPLCQNRGNSSSAALLKSNRTFLMKCELVQKVIDTLFGSSNFLPDNYFVQSMRRRILALSKVGIPRHVIVANCGKKADSTNKFGVWSDGDTFWKLVSEDMVRRYINTWNTKPPNRLVLENQLDVGSKLEDILRRGVEHDHLGLIMKQFNSLIMSFIYGTGCPQLNMGFALQLQRKGTSMDYLNFRVDIKPLQPPQDVNKDGKTAYSMCSYAGMSARTLLETYRRLARLTQFQEHSGENPEVFTDAVFRRVVELFGISDGTRCGIAPHALEFADISVPSLISTSAEVNALRRNMSLLQFWHDSIDLIGRDGNFLLGFGYIGTFPYAFCLGNGPLWDCVDNLKLHSEINNNVESYVDNGTTYCGSYSYTNGLEKLLGKGSLPVASNGGLPYWKLIHQQGVMLDLPEAYTPLSAGVSKQWVVTFKVEIVEDDGVRENVKVIGDLLPTSYKVNPRAERGRKKVANKGVPEKDLEDAIDDSNRRNTYVGHHSESDRLVIEWMKMLFIGIHPELSQLDNRSVVAKICSKMRLPILWMRVDSSCKLIGRIRRCQSSSMWEQQMMSDNNLFSQLEAAAAIGSYARSPKFVTTESPIIRIALEKLERMIKRHRIHPAVRARCLYSLVCLHNRDTREQERIQAVFLNYLSSLSMSNTGATYWHPSEARFMLDFFKAVSLLRDRHGYSPPMALDIFARVLEGMNGTNYLVHATNIVECSSYLSIPACSLRHAEEGNSSCLDIRRLWQLLWHLFRMDGIPGSGSCNRLLTASFLRCLSRQPLFLELCFSKFLHEKDLGFEFDFIHFLPLRQNIICLGQAAFELGQAYNSRHVHFAAIQSLIRVLVLGQFMVKDTVESSGEMETNRLSMVKLSTDEQLGRVQNFGGVHEAVQCCVKLCERLDEDHLKLDVWDAFGLVVEELAHSHPVVFVNPDAPFARTVRDLLFDQLRPYAISSHPFKVQMYIRIRKAIALIYGHGYIWDGDALPNAMFVAERIGRQLSGHSMPRIAAFRRVHGDGGSSSKNNWLEVAAEAIGALKELPQARWFVHDPDKSVAGYRSMVRHPMWLTKIEQKTTAGQYFIPMQFKADVALIFKNAKSVNKADSIPYADAVYLEEQFETLWPAIVRTFQKQAKALASS